MSLKHRRGFIVMLVSVVASGCLDRLTDGGRGTQFSVHPYEMVSDGFPEGVLDEAEVVSCDDERVAEHPVFPGLLEEAIEDSGESSGYHETTSTMEDPMREIPVHDKFAFVECEGRVWALTAVQLE